MNITRVSALSASAVTAVAVVYALGCAASGWDPSLGWLLQAVIHLGELAAVAALAWSGAVGDSRPGRGGLALAVAGQLLMAVAEVVYPHAHNLADTLFSIAPLLTGAGLITAGIVIRRRRRSSWLPLVLGLYTVIVLIPVMIGSGGPPSPAALTTIAGWDVLWLSVAASVLSPVPSPRPAKVTVE
jgi:hypothetical protein